MENSQKLDFIIYVGSLAMLCALLTAIALVNFSRKKQLAKESKIQALELKNKELEHKRQIENFKLVNEAEEKERQRLAKDLHDGVLPVLSTSCRSLEKNAMDFGTSQFDLTRMEKDIEIIFETVTTLRNVSHNLIPPYLVANGLIAALKQHVLQIDGSGPFKTTFTNHTNYKNNLPFTIAEQLNIYRVCLELLNNLCRHSPFEFLAFNILSDTEHLIIDIIHNGKAVTNQEMEVYTRNSNGLGLRSIQSRLMLLNARLDYIDQGETSRIKLHIPVAQNN